MSTIYMKRTPIPKRHVAIKTAGYLKNEHAELQSSNQHAYRGLMLRVAGFDRLLLFFGESTSGGAVFRDAARVDLTAGAAVFETAACFAVVVAARTLFFGTSRSTFSLSSLAASSLLRFFPRVEVVGTDFEGACLDTGLVVGLGAGAARAVAGRDVVVAAGAARVFGAGAGAVTGAGAGAAFFAVVFLVGTALAGAGAGLATGGGGGARSSMSGICRFVAGTRFTRRSRRDWRLAHWASHMARSFSLRALTEDC